VNALAPTFDETVAQLEDEGVVEAAARLQALLEAREGKLLVALEHLDKAGALLESSNLVTIDAARADVRARLQICRANLLLALRRTGAAP
jgi:predicted negative regulator of RcsB-dependent stress response